MDATARNLEFLLPRKTTFEVVENAVDKQGVRNLTVKVVRYGVTDIKSFLRSSP